MSKSYIIQLKKQEFMQLDIKFIALFSEKEAGDIRAGAVIRIYMVARLLLSWWLSCNSVEL